MARSTVWHPFTQHGLETTLPEIARARGAWLETVDNRRILDAISSWWVITHGHRHPAITEAIREQADKLDQVIFAGLTHAPAEKLAAKLIAIAPRDLEHVFYSDSGSTAVEVAIKMALGYFANRGDRRTRIAALEHAYHGDTVGTMSAGARSVFNAPYEPLLFDVVRLPFPEKGREQETLDAFEKAAKESPIAALVVEPLILGAGGMRIYSAETLRDLRRITADHGTLLIADEVMTGFGRTGTLFACEQAAVLPDILCLAKGLTGGTLPLAATLATNRIFDAHVSTDRARMFFHSSSFTANPICCAAALANLTIWQDEPVLDRIERLARDQKTRLEALSKMPGIANARQLGTITAFEIEGSNDGYLANLSLELRAHAFDRGVLLRPLGNTVYLMPPYCTTGRDLDQAYGAIESFLKTRAKA